MKQEDKDILLKDLLARFPHGVKVRVTPLYGKEFEHLSFDAKMFNINTNKVIGIVTDDNVKYIPQDIETIKPYLFPLSSMTEEQFNALKEYSDLKWNGCTLDLVEWENNTTTLEFWLEEVPSYNVFKVFDWLNSHHFDYLGLIEKGLAIDATNLNIY